jgi:hypothetical protein
VVELEVGTSVKVIKFGRCYTSYEGWVKKYAPQYHPYWEKKYHPSNGSGAVVVAKGKHMEYERMLYLIQDYGGHVCIIDVEGLEVNHESYIISEVNNEKTKV